MDILHKIDNISDTDFKSLFCSNKITNHSSQLLLNQKKLQIRPNQFFNNNKNQTQQIKIILKNPLRKNFIEFIKRSQSHIIHNDNNKLYDKLIIKRTFGTAPLRNRIKTQINKQNVLNCEQLFDKKTIKRSLSSIFNSNQFKNTKTQYKYSKPNIIYSSSKLPKDFFTKPTQINQYIKQVKKSSEQNQNLYQYLSHIDVSQKNYSSAIKLQSNSKNIHKNNVKTKVLIHQQLYSFSNQSNNSKKSIQIQQEFTFRQNSNIEQQKSNKIKNICNSSSSKFYKESRQNPLINQQQNKNPFTQNNNFLKVSPANFYQVEAKRKTSTFNTKNKKPIILLKL